MQVIDTPGMVDKFFTEYAKAFAYNDAKLIGSFFYLPCCFIHKDTVETFTEQEALADNLAQVLAHYQHMGVARSQATCGTCIELDSDHLVLEVQWQLKGSDQGETDAFSCVYQLVCKPDWKIVVLSNVSEVLGAESKPRRGPRPLHYPGQPKPRPQQSSNV